MTVAGGGVIKWPETCVGNLLRTAYQVVFARGFLSLAEVRTLWICTSDEVSSDWFLMASQSWLLHTSRAFHPLLRMSSNICRSSPR